MKKSNKEIEAVLIISAVTIPIFTFCYFATLWLGDIINTLISY